MKLNTYVLRQLASWRDGATLYLSVFIPWKKQGWWYSATYRIIAE